MQRSGVLLLVLVFIALAGSACQRDKGVFAGNESGNYQPQPENTDLKGELLRVNIAGKTIGVRVENGMEQTFRFDDKTTVTGLEGESNTANPTIRNLVGKEGSEVTAKWQDDKGARMATSIEVTQISTARKAQHSGRRR